MVILLSDAVLVRYSGKKFNGDPSFFTKVDRGGNLSWARRRLTVWAYAGFALLIIFYTSVGVLVAETRELPGWMGRLLLSMRYRRKKKSGKHAK